MYFISQYAKIRQNVTFYNLCPQEIALLSHCFHDTMILFFENTDCTDRGMEAMADNIQIQKENVKTLFLFVESYSIIFIKALYMIGK